MLLAEQDFATCRDPECTRSAQVGMYLAYTRRAGSPYGENPVWLKGPTAPSLPSGGSRESQPVKRLEFAVQPAGAGFSGFFGARDKDSRQAPPVRTSLLVHCNFRRVGNVGRAVVTPIGVHWS